MVLPGSLQLITQGVDLTEFILFGLIFMTFGACMDAGGMILLLCRLQDLGLPFVEVFGVDALLPEVSENLDLAADQRLIEFLDIGSCGNFDTDAVGAIDEEHAFATVFAGV